MSVVYKQVVYFIFQLIFFIESGLLINFLLVQIRKCSVSCRRAFHKKPPTKQTEIQAKKKTHVVDVHVQMKKYLGWV